MADHIQIGDVSPRIQYVGDGIQASFTYPFPVFKADDLEIHLGSQKQEAGFTVSGAGIAAGGSVLFAVPPADGVVVTLRRRLVVERTADFQADGLIRAKTLNDELDYQTAAIQQLADDLGRCVARPATSASAADLSLPEPAAGRAIKWNANADALVNSGFDPDTLGSAAATAAAAQGAAVVARDGAVAAQAAAEIARDQAVAAAASVGDPLARAENLADLPDKAAARVNLSLYSAAETDAAIAAAGLTEALLDRLAFLETNLAVNTLRDQIDAGWSVLQMVDGIADEFEDQTGIGDLGGATYDAAGDCIHNAGTSGSLTLDGSMLTVEEPGLSGTAVTTPACMFDNVLNNAAGVTAEAGSNGSKIILDCGLPVALTSIGLHSYGGPWTNGYGVWHVRHSDNGTTWNGAGASLTTSNTQTWYDSPAISSGYHRWWALECGFTGDGTGAVNELRASGTVAPVNTTIVSAAAPNAPAAPPDEARLVLLHQPVDAVTLDTDLIAEASRDGGTTWTAIALADEGPFDSSTDILAGIADLSGQPSGTSMKWRVRTLNNKEQRLHGVWMQWR